LQPPYQSPFALQGAFFLIIPKSLEYNPLAMGIHPSDVETIRCSDFIIDNPVCRQSQSDTCIIGVLKGEGIGPEVAAEALKVRSAIEEATDRRFEVYSGGEMGLEAELKYGASLPDQTSEFCRDMFSKVGPSLQGRAGAGSFTLIAEPDVRSLAGRLSECLIRAREKAPRKSNAWTHQ
jgi:hypothetical protein